MNDLSKSVRSFHEKHGFPLDVDITKLPPEKGETVLGDHTFLYGLGRSLKMQSLAIQARGLKEQAVGDPRTYRAHLLMEELGELILAMSSSDEVKVADGCADLAYVTIGTLETFGLPSDEVIQEVCDSNMTKAVRKNDMDRMRDKGPDYRPPDLKSAIEKGKDSRRWSKQIQMEVGQ